jgi:hypothetical protein
MRHVVTAADVEAAAYAGETELTYDSSEAIITPLARERANDLTVRLRAVSSGAQARKRGAKRDPGDGSPAQELLKDMRPELAAEVLRRVQQRLDQQ